MAKQDARKQGVFQEGSMSFSRNCFYVRESSCGSRSNVGGRATSSVGDKHYFQVMVDGIPPSLRGSVDVL
jgi:hypothetical protein